MWSAYKCLGYEIAREQAPTPERAEAGRDACATWPEASRQRPHWAQPRLPHFPTIRMFRTPGIGNRWVIMAVKVQALRRAGTTAAVVGRFVARRYFSIHSGAGPWPATEESSRRFNPVQANSTCSSPAGEMRIELV